MRIGAPSTVCSVVYGPAEPWYGPIIWGVRVIGADHDQRVGVRGLELLGDADGVVHADQLADLATGVRGVVALVDRGALDLEHEALRVALQQLDGLVGHLGQRRLGAAVGRLALGRRRARAGVRRDQRLDSVVMLESWNRPSRRWPGARDVTAFSSASVATYL